jgi:hypothetical protein
MDWFEAAVKQLQTQFKHPFIEKVMLKSPIRKKRIFYDTVKKGLRQGSQFSMGFSMSRFLAWQVIGY